MAAEPLSRRRFANHDPPRAAGQLDRESVLGRPSGADGLEHRPAADPAQLLPVEGDAAGAAVDAQLDGDAGGPLDLDLRRRRR